MKTVIHKFKKRPNAKNLANRSVSFSRGETDHIGKEDDVEIEIQTKSGYTSVFVTGEQFLSSLEDKSTKDGIKIKVFKF